MGLNLPVNPPRQWEDLVLNFDALASHAPVSFVTPVVLATLGSGNVAWTTVDISAYVPAGAKAALLRVGIDGVAIGAGYATNRLDFRATGSTAVAVSCSWKVAGTVGTGGGREGQEIVPLAAAKFDFQKTDGINSSSSATITLEGYVR